MPLVANSNLPTFSRLKEEGGTILSAAGAAHQDIRELHIGLLNMMPDAALAATERQFFRLIGESNQIAQFHMHPFTLDGISRGEKGKNHIAKHYQSFDEIKEQGLDALIITGANVTQPDLSKEAFWNPLIDVIDWAYENVTSTICSCLATHAVMEFRYNQKRHPLPKKKWGIYSHGVVERNHPLVCGVDTRFNVPHSRYNQIDRKQFDEAGLKVLVESQESGVHLAVSEDLFRLVFFQGHPEYDIISLLKEYKREIALFINNDITHYPPFPENYFDKQTQSILNEYKKSVKSAASDISEFPEQLILNRLDNTWHDTAEAVINKWIGKVYQITNNERHLPFMDGIKADDPLGLK